MVDGPVESAGRVEICINGVWGTVCGYFSLVDYWDNSFARIVCRQLGYGVNPGRGELVKKFVMYLGERFYLYGSRNLLYIIAWLGVRFEIRFNTPTS